jgi:hemolysin-activating ACP:hemolysin acyltransferase
MWGKRRGAVEKASEGILESLHAPIADSSPTAADAPNIASEIARHLEAAPNGDASLENSDTRHLLDVKSTSPIKLNAPSVVRANPISTAFGDMVALLAKSPAHRHLSLADLEWLLLPPVALGQYALADSKLSGGEVKLTAFALWAQVSNEVDFRLSVAPRHPIRLLPNEWRSGDIFYVIEAVGVASSVQQIIKTLADGVFQSKPFRMFAMTSHEN